jgi:hypothetical protein
MATVIMEIACSTDEADCRAHLLITEPALMLLLALEHGAERATSRSSALLALASRRANYFDLKNQGGA